MGGVHPYCGNRPDQRRNPSLLGRNPFPFSCSVGVGCCCRTLPRNQGTRAEPQPICASVRRRSPRCDARDPSDAYEEPSSQNGWLRPLVGATPPSVACAPFPEGPVPKTPSNYLGPFQKRSATCSATSSEANTKSKRRTALQRTRETLSGRRDRRPPIGGRSSFEAPADDRSPCQLSPLDQLLFQRLELLFADHVIVAKRSQLLEFVSNTHWP